MEDKPIPRIRITKKKKKFLSSAPMWVTLFLMAGVGATEYYSSANIYTREQKAYLRNLEIQADVSRAEMELEAQEANRRYQSGCQMVLDSQVSQHGRRDLVVPLSPGMVIRSPDTGEVLADGQIVCDHKFMTFEIVNGVTANGKKANDADLVNQRFEDNLGWDPKVKRGDLVPGS